MPHWEIQTINVCAHVTSLKWTWVSSFPFKSITDGRQTNEWFYLDSFTLYYYKFKSKKNRQISFCFCSIITKGFPHFCLYTLLKCNWFWNQKLFLSIDFNFTIDAEFYICQIHSVSTEILAMSNFDAQLTLEFSKWIGFFDFHTNKIVSFCEHMCWKWNYLTLLTSFISHNEYCCGWPYLNE